MLLVLFREGGKTLGRAFVKTVLDIVFCDRMSVSEAQMILDVAGAPDMEKVRSTYERMYSANSRENKGSPYIQSKVLAAYKVLERTPRD
jgi:DnaJ homolog subfamily C member 19